MRQTARRLVAVVTITLMSAAAAHVANGSHLAGQPIGGGDPLGQTVMLRAGQPVGGGGPLLNSRHGSGLVA